VNPGGGAGEAASVIVFASLAFAVITAVGVGVWSIYSSHRLCGPLYLITQYLNEVRDGRIPANLRSLRKKDEFKDFYGTVSAAIDAMRERKGHEVAALTRAIDAMSELHSADGADREALLNSVEKQLVALRDAAADELGEEQQVSNRSVVEDARVMMSV